jgi:hypothetical protein
VELAADSSDEFLGCADRVLITPGCDGIAGPGQICGLFLAVSHRLLPDTDSRPTQ